MLSEQGHVSCGFRAFRALFFPQPRHGAGERVSVMLRSGGTGRGLSFPAPCLTHVQKLCGTKQSPFLPGKGSEMAPLLRLLRRPRRCSRGVGTGGTRGDRAAPPPRVSGAKNIPRRTAGRTLPQGTIAACALLSKALDSALLLYSVSSAEFWTFPQLPGHRDCATVTRRRWLLALLGLGGHDGERGCISTSTCIGHALPRQELTSSM